MCQIDIKLTKHYYTHKSAQNSDLIRDTSPCRRRELTQSPTVGQHSQSESLRALIPK